MILTQRRRRMTALLGLALLSGAVLAPPAPAGPVAEMLARHRKARQTKLPPMDKPFVVKPVRDPYAATTSLSGRFKQRFGLGRPGLADPGVVRTSR